MYVESHDYRPPTAFYPPPPDSAQLAGGVAAVLMVPGGAVVAAIAFAAAATALLASQAEDRPVVYEEIIEAEFVRLGKPLDPNKLPNRKVPLQATAPDDSVVVSQDPNDPKNLDAGVEPPPHAVESEEIANLLERAHVFDEIGKQRDLEGSPDGIPEGTSDRTTPGSMLKIFFQRGWTTPNVISDAELKKLVALVRVRFNTNVAIAEYELAESSGNPLFDQSVLDQLQRLQTSKATVPDSPEDPADGYAGQWMTVRYDGKNAR